MPRYYSDEPYSVGRRRWIYNSFRNLARNPSHVAQLASLPTAYIGKRMFSWSKQKKYDPRNQRSTRRFKRRRRRTYTRRGVKTIPGVRKELTSLRKYVQKNLSLQRQLTSASLATLNYKYRSVANNAAYCTYNQIDYGYAIGVDKGLIDAILTQVPIFNPAVPATPSVVDISSGAHQKKVFFPTIRSTYYLTNLTAAPVRCIIYKLIPVNDTNLHPLDALSHALSEITIPGITDYGISSPMLFPSKCGNFSNYYKIIDRQVGTLQPGKQVKMSHFIKNLWYDPSIVEHHTSSYQRRHKCHFYMVRVEGTPARVKDTGDVKEGEVMTQEAWLCQHVEVEATMKYDAGADYNFTYLNDNFTAYSTQEVGTRQRGDGDIVTDINQAN